MQQQQLGELGLAERGYEFWIDFSVINSHSMQMCRSFEKLFAELVVGLVRWMA